MRNTLILLSSLALAVAASAQTFVVQPTALSGFGQGGHLSGVFGPRPGFSPVGLWSSLRTKAVYVAKSRVQYSHGIAQTVYDLDESRLGWVAEFALPPAPTGAALASATLSASAVGLADSTGTVTKLQPVAVATYAGDGKTTVGDVPNRGSGTGFVVAPGAASFDVTKGIGSLLAVGQKYAGLRVERSGYQGSLTKYDILGWSSPTLTLVYGYPARASLLLGGYDGDPTKVPVAYEVRRPGTREVVVSGTLAPDADGAVRPLVPPGTWDVSFRASHWLRRTLRGVTVEGASGALPDVRLVNGDVDGDDRVTKRDLQRVADAQGAFLGDPGYDAAADLTGDGRIDARDRAVAARALGMVGDD